MKRRRKEAARRRQTRLLIDRVPLFAVRYYRAELVKREQELLRFFATLPPEQPVELLGDDPEFPPYMVPMLAARCRLAEHEYRAGLCVDAVDFLP